MEGIEEEVVPFCIKISNVIGILEIELSGTLVIREIYSNGA